MQQVPGKNGGLMARFPKMPAEQRTPNTLPILHWSNVKGHLEQHQPNNKQGIRKAIKMLFRLLNR